MAASDRDHVDVSNPVYRDIVQHIPKLRGYARAMTHNAVAAEDLLQDCLVRALTKADLFREGTNLRAWLFTMLHNLHINERRQYARAPVVMDTEVMEDRLSVPPDQDWALVLRSARQAIESLPSEHQIALCMVVIEGYRYDEVAACLGLPVGTVKSRVSRGRDLLECVVNGAAPSRRDGQRRSVAA